MPDSYRFRGNVEPSAAVSRPVAAYRNTTTTAKGAQPGAGSATLDIFDVIDSFGGYWGISADDVDAALKQIGDVDTLYVRLNSPGGEATEGVAIANLLRAHPATVRVTVYGLAASAASYIAIAGDTVNMGPGSLMFVHDAWDVVAGDAADLRQSADALDTISDSIAGLYMLKAGGTTEQWRAVMHADTWYSAEAAVAAKLADNVGLDPHMPGDLPPVEDPDDTDAMVVEIDVEISPAARAAARRFDLSMLPHAPTALINPADAATLPPLAEPKTPAEPPVTTTQPKEEADMADTESKGLRERLGLPDDADDAAVLAKVDEVLTASTAAASADIDPAKAEEALTAAGKVVVSQTLFDELKEGAQAGAAARAKQLADERDETVQAAYAAGKISRDRIQAWATAWDKDPEGTKKDLAELQTRFPVAALAAHGSYPGGDNDGSTEPFSDEEAAALAERAGISKEALVR